MSVYSNQAEFFKKLRQTKKLTQAQLAEALSLHPQFVSNWERGICSPPEQCFPKLQKQLKFNKRSLFAVMMKDSKQANLIKLKMRFR